MLVRERVSELLLHYLEESDEPLLTELCRVTARLGF